MTRRPFVVQPYMVVRCAVQPFLLVPCTRAADASTSRYIDSSRSATVLVRTIVQGEKQGAGVYKTLTMDTVLCKAALHVFGAALHVFGSTSHVPGSP